MRSYLTLIFLLRLFKVFLAEDVAYLYDIETDPNESTKLLDDSSYSEEV
jgi:hypothetical protein